MIALSSVPKYLETKYPGPTLLRAWPAAGYQSSTNLHEKKKKKDIFRYGLK